MSRTFLRFVFALSLGLLSTACGDDPTAGRGIAKRSPPPMAPEVPVDQKVRFALDRLLHGPLPRTAAFRIDRLHLQTIEHARKDLAALPEATLELLSDPDLIRRLADPKGADRNPWHNLLDVLTSLPEKDTQVVMAWAAPATEVVGDLPLQRRAVQALISVRDPETASTVLAFLRLRTTDRPLAVPALRALIEFGTPWREEALAVTYAHGDLGLWSKVSEELERVLDQTDPGDAAGRSAMADALAWWTLLTQSSGPGPTPGSGRTEAPAWMPARLILDPAVWPDDTKLLERALRVGRVLAPRTVLESAGYLARGASEAPGFALPTLLYPGTLSATAARCVLARAEFPAYVEDCPASQATAMDAEDARIVLDLFVEDLKAGSQPEAVGVGQALAVLGAQDTPAAVALTRAMLAHARPAGFYRGLLEMLASSLLGHDRALLLEDLNAFVESGSPEDEAAALLLVRQVRLPALIPAVEVVVRRSDPAAGGALRKLLMWLHSADGVPPDRQAAFAKRYARWVEEAPDAQARVLAPGLLDLGEPGAEAYAAGLRGERRTVFAEGLLHRSHLVPLAVAEALLEGLDAATSPVERHAILVAVYRTAPPAAAGALGAARARLPEGIRPEVDDILASVTHRANR